MAEFSQMFGDIAPTCNILFNPPVCSNKSDKNTSQLSRSVSNLMNRTHWYPNGRDSRVLNG